MKKDDIIYKDIKSKMFETNTQNNSSLISLSRAAQLSGYHQDYLGQLCRAGKLPASKIGRHWFTSKDAVEKLNEAQSQAETISPIEQDLDQNQNDVDQEFLQYHQAVTENSFSFPQPRVLKSMVISEVDGLPIALQTINIPTRPSNNVQNVVTNLRIQTLQSEVGELREMLVKLMQEVTEHTQILAAQNMAARRPDSLRNQFISNFDLSSNHASVQQNYNLVQPQTSQLEVTFSSKKSFPFSTWLIATTAVVMLVYIAVGIFSGSFVGSGNTEVSTLYYHSQPQFENFNTPTVAGESTSEMLPTGSSGEQNQDMIQ